MKNRIVIFFILLRHGLNPFKPIGALMSAMRERLSEKEKTYIINSAKYNSIKVVLIECLKRQEYNNDYCEWKDINIQ